MTLAALHRLPDVKAFVKNSMGESGANSFIEYQKENGNIASYYPDFLVKTADTTFFVLETKGREDLDDVRKIKRLDTWCKDVNAAQSDYHYTPLYVKQEDWDRKRGDIKRFSDMVDVFKLNDR